MRKSFWEYVDKTDDCWIWNGYRDHDGYGIVSYKHVPWRVPRLAYFWLMGDIPDEFDVCHHCDNPPCLRPDHLFLGDDAINSQDMMRKGRHRVTIGEDKPNRLLSNEIVREILSNPPTKHGDIAKIARGIGISHGALMHVLKRRTWKHISI
ncbi:MAG: HNH endonuclease [Pseudomonadota bacterium]